MNSSRFPSRRLPTAVALVAVLVAGVTACSDDKPSDASSPAPSSISRASSPSSAPQVTKAWVRTTPANVMTTAAYFTVTSATDDALLKVSVDPSVAGETQIHETSMATDTSMATNSSMATDSSMASGSSMPGAMSMHPVDSIALPAGTAVELKPGGYHVMLMKLVKPLEAGSQVKLTLTFEKAGELVITAPVGDAAP